MDYTLARYKIDAFEGFMHSLAVSRLVADYGYPRKIKELHFDRERAIVGLVIDKRYGNLIKISRFGTVKMAYHGLKEIDFRERTQLYRKQVITLGDPDFTSLDSAFELSTGILFSQLIELREEGEKLPDYRQIIDDIQSCIDSLHKDGTLKSAIKSDFKRFVDLDERTAHMLERLKSYSKKLILITNSDFDYTRPLMNYVINPFLKEWKSWDKIFDIVITHAEKPLFFESNRRFLKIDPETGMMSNHEGLISPGFWQGGSFDTLEKSLGIQGDEVLYIGDHIYGDMVSIKKLCAWRTGLVLCELDNELKAIQASRNIQKEIDRLMRRKTEIETMSDKAEMDRHYGGKTRLPPELISEQDKLNTHISSLLDKLKPNFNTYWGEILRAGTEESRYADQVEKYACIYMTRVSDLYACSPRAYLRPPRRQMAHEFD